jgi:putative nucleotidyltransferase with HDIG domain
MSPLETLKSKVTALYESKNPDRANWADWLYTKHVFVVARYADELAKRFGANPELAAAAGMLHDIADAVTKREDPKHEAESISIARKFLSESGFSSEEIAIVVDDAIRFHSCQGSDAPQSLEGKVMATADALGHLKTDFYDFALDFFKQKHPIPEIKNWALPKIERDYRKKIFFEDIRQETTTDYERAKALFSTL